MALGVHGLLAALAWRLKSLAAVIFGFLVHFRLFPVVYTPSLALAAYRCAQREVGSTGRHGTEHETEGGFSLLFPFRCRIAMVAFVQLGALMCLGGVVYPSISAGAITSLGLTFRWLCLSALSCVVSTLIAFLACGFEYVNSAILYHAGREDVRHNLSVFFLPLYLLSA